MWRIFTNLRQTFSSLPKVRNATKVTSDIKESKFKDLTVISNNRYKWRSYSNELTSSSYKGREKRDYKAHHDGPFYQIDKGVLEAFGLGGLIFLSWYVCFPWCRRRLFSNPAERYVYQKLEYANRRHYAYLGKCISEFILKTPIDYGFPTVNAVRSRQQQAATDEAIRQGCAALEDAHRNVTSSLNNWLGTECMQKGHYKQAYSHFSKAAEENHAAALFNLGICNEMGLGTEQCFKKAADLYKRAADLGHATAMYNLGVFHVHGWGGVTPDGEVAQQLFTAAAQRGQTDAVRLLNWSETEKMGNSSQIVEPKDNDMTDAWFKVLNINLNSDIEELPKKERLISVDSGINDLSPSQDLELVFPLALDEKG